MSLENAALDIDEEDFVDELKPGTKLMHGQYTIEEFLAAGGFGITYLARDSLNRQLVIKECFPGNLCRRQNSSVTPRSRSHQDQLKSVVRLFLQEAMSLAKANHPNIVGVHQVFEENNTAYMALDYIEGRDLLELLQDDHDSLTQPLVEGFLTKMLDAIEHIHQLGILHRDISPDNILINEQGEPILIDFGAARECVIDENSRQLSALRVVKEGYSPQEFYIVGSEQSPSSDLYSLAASFYHIITQELPPDSQVRLSSFASGDNDPYVSLGKRTNAYSDNFVTALDKALEILPRDRMQNAAEWLAHLSGNDAIAAEQSGEQNAADADGPAAHKPVANSSDKKSLVPLLLCTTALVVIVGGGIFFAKSSGSEDTSNTSETSSISTANNAPSANTALTPEITPSPAETLALAPAAPADVPSDPVASAAVEAPAPQGVTEDLATSEVAAPQNPAVEEAPGFDGSPIVLALPNTAIAPPSRPLRETDVALPELEIAQPFVNTIAPVSMVAPVDVTETGQPQALQSGTITPEANAFLESIQRSDLTLVAALPDTIPLALPSALPPAPEPAPSSFVASFIPALPFTLSDTQPGQIASVTDNGPAWLTENARIVSINGLTLSENAEITEQLNVLAAQNDASTFDVSLGMATDQSDSTIEQSLTIKKRNRIQLLNGLTLIAREDDGMWKTEVIVAPDTSNFKVGDVIVSYIKNWENLDGPNSLKTILERELANEVSTFGFAVRRNGQIWMEEFNLAALAD